jgi:hypothetical protein
MMLVQKADEQAAAMAKKKKKKKKKPAASGSAGGAGGGGMSVCIAGAFFEKKWRQMAGLRLLRVARALL